jgi:hypothetical protein
MEKDSLRLDFIECWEVTQQPGYWFTLLTQLVSQEQSATLRDFCDYGIDFEKMLDQNGIDVIAWHSLPTQLKAKVETYWREEDRSLTQEEKEELEAQANQYWSEKHSTGIN